jgi:N-glycosylase/DNA lyase
LKCNLFTILVMQKYQEYTIQNQDSFELNHIFDCGQCFRRNQQPDWSYTWVFWNNVLNIQKKSDSIIFSWIVDWDIQSIVNQYFDLDRDYNQIKFRLSKVDNYMKESIQYWHGIRLLNQDLWETIISFIISANNNIPRIKWIIERLSQKYWTEINLNWQPYCTFPTAQQLKDVSISDYRKLWLWFRDERVFTTTRMVLDWKIDLNSLYSKLTPIVREELLDLSWIWPKVADCILLFSDLKRLEVFPIDVRVRRVMNQLYIHNPDETKVNKNQIQKLAQEKFGNYAWLAQEYLFYRARTQKI